MASDRARISYDPTRAYRAVVAQQGRVTLEADVNEASLIETEALRLETIDIIGPAGTPSVPSPGDGYLVISGPTPADTVIHEGLYYLGGWRVALGDPVTINAQPDWLDAPPLPQIGTGLVALLLTEQSVCAVEDQALREVALGGPDSAARLRLMQRFPLIGLEADTCESAAAILAKNLAGEGITIDPYSLELLSDARLQVSFVADTAPADPCTPLAPGGYLGADNQMVRVTVSDYEPHGQTGEILWGWNNASILYRSTLTDKTKGVFTLTGAPIDQEHAPQLGQAIEILRARADLKNGDFIAADSGFVTTVAEAYSFDTGTLTIANIAGLPADYVNDPNPLFVRLWQAIVPFTAGQPTPLDSVSGLAVTVTLTALPTDFVARPFWRFSARPDTPTLVYPRRYYDGPQLPDGPRQWLGDLGVIGPVGDGYGLLADCRPSFTPLTDQTSGGCCGLTLDPAGVTAMGGLQAVVDTLAGGPAILSLKPGTYALAGPVVLTRKHEGLTIEGCALGVFLEPDTTNLAAFVFGLIILEDAVGVTLRGLDLDVPLVPPATGAQGGTLVGILAVNTILTVVEDCDFGLLTTAPGALGGAVTVIGFARDLSVRRCIFKGKSIDDAALVCGVLASVNTQNVRTLLSDVDIVENLFQALNAGVFVYARLGEIRCANNRVRDCVTGFLFADTALGGTGAFARQAFGADQTHFSLARAVQASFPAPTLAMSVQSQAPFFTKGVTDEAEVSTVADEVLKADITARGTAIYQEVVAHAARVGGQAAPEFAAGGSGGANPAYVAALDHVNTVSVNAEATSYQPVNAALHIHENDLILASVSADAKPGVGIGVMMSPKDEAGMILVGGNRVACRDTLTCALAVLFPEFLTVSANILVQPTASQTGLNTPALIAFTLGSALSEFAGNVIRSGAYILPPRTAPTNSPDWTFFNTVA